MNDLILAGVFLLGVLLVTIGLYYNKKRINIKQIAAFPVLEDNKPVNFTEAGKYSLAIHGGAIVHKFPLKIVSDGDNKSVDLYEKALKFRDFKNGNVEVTYCYFTITNPGKYSVIITDYNKVSVKQYVPKLFSPVVNDDVPVGRLSIVIREYFYPLTYSLFIGPLIFGILMIMFSVSLILFNHGILKKESSSPTTTTYTL